MAIASGDLTFLAVLHPDETSGDRRYLVDVEIGRLVFAHIASVAGKAGYFAGSWQAQTTDVTALDQILALVLADPAGGTVYRDGISIGTGNYSALAVGGTIALGAVYGGGSDAYDGRLAEVLVYDSALSDADRGKVESYLANKYGISI